MTSTEFNPDDYEFFRILRERKNKPKPAPRPVNIGPVDTASGLGTKYGLTALASELETLRQAPEGTRNDTLNRACFSLAQIVAAGQLDRNHTYTELYHTALSIGLTETETQATLASAYGAGSMLPRDIKPASDLTPPVVTVLHPGQPGQGSSTPIADHVGRSPDMAGHTPFSTPQPAVDGVTQYNSPAEIMQIEERTSWWPRNIEDAITGINTEPEPSILKRSDGLHLFTTGRVNGIIGESESGKTWIALQAVLEQARDGHAVTYIDFEDTDTGVIGRLKTLGLTEDEIRAHVAYISPDETLNISAASDLQEHLAQHQPSLIVIDGMNAAMTLLDLDLMSNQDTTKFAQLLLNPLAATGAAVCFIDHTPKGNTDTKGGIGAQAKRAMTTGCTLKVEVIEPFGRGQNGRLELWVDKDRTGHVRGASLNRAGGQYAAAVNITSHNDNHLTISIESPHPKPGAEHKPFEPTHLMEQVSKLLEDLEGKGVSTKNILDTVKGRDDYIRKALEALVEQGYVKRERAARGAIEHRSLKPYRDPSTPPEVTTLDTSQQTAAIETGERRKRELVRTSTGQLIDAFTGEIIDEQNTKN